jgi:hypothetical protein
VFEPSILGALLQDHPLTSGFSPEETARRLKELGIVMYAGAPNIADIEGTISHI